VEVVEFPIVYNMYGLPRLILAKPRFFVCIRIVPALDLPITVVPIADK